MVPARRLNNEEANGGCCGRKENDLPFLFVETYGREVEEELSTMATQYWAEGGQIGKCCHEQKKPWMRQIQEVQTWKQVRGPAGAVMCEIRDLGIKWPQRHTLMFEGEVSVDMRYTSSRNVKKMLVQQWAAKHEYQELREGSWSEPALALLRKTTNEKWIENHRNVARKLFLEGGWVQKKLFDIGWSDESECQACHSEEGTEKHRHYYCPELYEVRRGIPEAFRKWEQKARISKKEWNWQKGIVAHPFSESRLKRGHFSMTKWESEKHKSWGMPAEGFGGHVATDGSLPGIAGKWGACGWSMVQLDYDGNWSHCMVRMARWRQNWKSSALSRRRS